MKKAGQKSRFFVPVRAAAFPRMVMQACCFIYKAKNYGLTVLNK